MTTLEASMKRCTDCDEPLPLEAFPASRTSKDGRQACCKQCRGRRAGIAPSVGEVPRRADAVPKRPYRGVSGGMLLAGYVPAPAPRAPRASGATKESRAPEALGEDAGRPSDESGKLGPWASRTSEETSPTGTADEAPDAASDGSTESSSGSART